MEKGFIYYAFRAQSSSLDHIRLSIMFFFLCMLATGLRTSAHAKLNDTYLSITNVHKTGVWKREDIKYISNALFLQGVRGVVVDSTTGEPLVGVTIKVKGSTIGTTTGGSGEFSLEVSDNAILEVSYVGYNSKEIAVGDKKNIKIMLSATATGLHQLVVVGYQEKERGELTGSVATLGGQSLVQHRTTDLVKSLQGTMPGLIVKDVGGEPGREDASILIRGVHTLGDNSPLFVVDGVPQKSISQISPYDIESISVLKDASAAIYGARAANGVILITTKRGSTGKVALHLNAQYGFSALTRKPKIQNSYQYAIYRNEAREAVGQSDQFTEQDIELYKNRSQPLTHPNTDWYKDVYKDLAPVSTVNISASGGSEDVQFYLSGSYHHQEANYRSGAGLFNRYQVRSNVDAHINKYLKLGADIVLRLEKSKMPSVSALDIMHGVWFAYPTEVDQFPNGFYGAVHEDRNMALVSSYLPGYNSQNGGVVRPKLSVDLDLGWLTKGLNLSGYAAYDWELNNTEVLQHPVEVYNYDAGTDTYNGRKTNWPGGGHNQYHVTNERYKDQLYHIQLSYKRGFGNHNVSAFIAAETDVVDSSSILAGRKDLFSINKVQLFAGQEDGRTVGGTTVLGGRINYFGSLSYDYKKKYMVNFTLRDDGSFNFPRGKRFGIFPGISAAWNITKESFLSSSRAIDNLKLRASYGEMGNDRVPSYQYLTRYNVNSFVNFGQNPVYNSAITIANIPNPNITWETSKMLDFGLDAILFNNINITFDYFYEKRRGILIKRNLSVPLYTAITLPYENLGKVDNWGVEFQAGYNNSIGDISYSVTGNFTFNRDKIIFMDEAADIPSYQKQEGHPVSSFLAYVADGLFKDQEDVDRSPHIPGAVPGFIKYVDLNGDGQISSLDQKRFYKGTTPEIQFGLNATLNYKGLRLYFMFQGQGGALNAIRFNDDGAKPEEYFTERWTEENRNAKEPRPTLGFSQYNLLSTFAFKNAAYLRLKNIEVSYDMAAFLPKDVFKECRVFIRGKDVWTLSEIKLFDPELPFVPDTRGNRARYYPQLSEYSFGFNITF